jgi:hypothetical protein
MKKHKVTMVTVSARDLKRAFRKTFPDKTVSELTPLWARFWAGMVLAARVEKIESNEAEDEQPVDPSDLPAGPVGG